MDPRPHPFPGKLSFNQAEEIRRLRHDGVPLADLAETMRSRSIRSPASTPGQRIAWARVAAKMVHTVEFDTIRIA